MAGEVGVRAPETIIRKVAAAVAQFRTLATKHGVRAEWIGRVETTITGHLKSWGEWKGESDIAPLTINGHTLRNLRIEQTYKGNYHLLAEIDGKERKFVISKNKEDFALIESTGISNLTPTHLRSLAEKYFFT